MNLRLSPSQTEIRSSGNVGLAMRHVLWGKLGERQQRHSGLAHPAVQRGRMKTHYAREQVREESLGVAQEGALALHAPKLLQESEGYDLRIREPLEGLVAPPFRVEQRVGIVDEAEEDGQSLFRLGEASSRVMSPLAYLLLMVSRDNIFSMREVSATRATERRPRQGLRGPLGTPAAGSLASS